MKEAKRELRQLLRAEAARHSSEERARASESLRALLKRQDVWQEARSVLLFMPIAGEPDILPLAADLLAEGKTLALPRYSGENDPYHARRVADLSADLEPGMFGIEEPRLHCPLIDVKPLDLVLVPGIGFSPVGQRLGRGKGFYDRLLAKAEGTKCGVAFDWQVVDFIPTELHDVLVNCTITPTRWLEAPSAGRV